MRFKIKRSRENALQIHEPDGKVRGKYESLAELLILSIEELTLALDEAERESS